MNTNILSRRDFTRLAVLGSAGIAFLPVGCNSESNFKYADDELLNLSEKLLAEWCNGLIKYQITDYDSKGLYGGIICPACARIHGRIGDAMYPLMHMANKTGQDKYLQSAKLLFLWTENNVSSEDGSIVNDVNISNHRGITVNWVVSLADALRHHGQILDNNTRQEWTDRMRKAIEYTYDSLTLGNVGINYASVTSYAMAVIGEMLDEQKYITRAREFAHFALDKFTENDKILFGEGGRGTSPKGLHPVDIGYNMEVSLPHLVMYANFTNDNEVIEAVTESMRAHLEFYLPDGALDNSFGTRNYKWTYWGTITGDGAQPGLALLADKEPGFYKAAYQNTVLMKNLTHGGILHGGPHLDSRGIPPCIHHNLLHTKALATILDSIVPGHKYELDSIVLPREEENGVKEFRDLHTFLISIGEWRATITGYDYENTNEGHATGGALSVLWSKEHGPVMIASNTQYQLREPGNMQMDLDIHSMALTPRLEFFTENTFYRNINDKSAEIKWHKEGEFLVFDCYANLVDGSQNSPTTGVIPSHIQYRFSNREMTINIIPERDISGIRFIFPIISTNDEQVENIDNNTVIIQKKNGDVKLIASTEIHTMESSNGRIFNFVPGMEALPLAVNINKETSLTLSLT